jgi:hypothetical protein
MFVNDIRTHNEWRSIHAHQCRGQNAPTQPRTSVALLEPVRSRSSSSTEDGLLCGQRHRLRRWKRSSALFDISFLVISLSFTLSFCHHRAEPRRNCMELYVCHESFLIDWDFGLVRCIRRWQVHCFVRVISMQVTCTICCLGLIQDARAGFTYGSLCFEI